MDGENRESISVIVPCYREDLQVARQLVQFANNLGDAIQLIVCGADLPHSSCKLLKAASKLEYLDYQGKPSRASQLNFGARSSRAEVLFFIHADTKAPGDFFEQILSALASGVDAGCFSVHFDGNGWRFALLGLLSNLRSRILGISYGDQGIFITKTLYDELGGFTELSLFEDLDFVSRIRKRGKRFVHLPAAVITSARRFAGSGFLRRLVLNQVLLVGYLLGIKTETLHRLY